MFQQRIMRKVLFTFILYIIISTLVHEGKVVTLLNSCIMHMYVSKKGCPLFEQYLFLKLDSIGWFDYFSRRISTCRFSIGVGYQINKIVFDVRLNV